MTPDEARAYREIVLNEPQKKEYPPLTADEKRAYADQLDEMRATVPGMKKLLMNHQYIPFTEVNTLLMFQIWKTQRAILDKLEEER